MKSNQAHNNALDIVQNCWVVPDLSAAMQQWLSWGYGPFLTIDMDLPNALYRGEVEPLKCSVALAYGGGVQIELIQQHSSGRSAYRDSFGPREGGFHHVCIISNDYETDVARLRERGIALATEGESFGMKFCYADTRKSLGCMLEVVPDVPLIRGLYKAVNDSADGWKGDNPIRQFRI